MERKVKKGSGQMNPAVRKMRRIMIPLIRGVTIRIVTRRFIERCMELTGLPQGVVEDLDVPKEVLMYSCKRALLLLDFSTEEACNEKEVRSVATEILEYIPYMVENNLSGMVTDQMIWSLVSKAYVEMYKQNFVLNEQMRKLRLSNRIYELSIKHPPCYGNYTGGNPNCLLCDADQVCSQEHVNIVS